MPINYISVGEFSWSKTTEGAGGEINISLISDD